MQGQKGERRKDNEFRRMGRRSLILQVSESALSIFKSLGFWSLRWLPSLLFVFLAVDMML